MEPVLGTGGNCNTQLIFSHRVDICDWRPLGAQHALCPRRANNRLFWTHSPPMAKGDRSNSGYTVTQILTQSKGSE